MEEQTYQVETTEPSEDNNSSILVSIKMTVGIEPSYTIFDPELTLHINSVFAILHQIGIGPKEGFALVTGEEKWSEFLQSMDMYPLNLIKTYMAIRIRLLFDRPDTSYAAEAMEKMAQEYEWRMMVAKEEQDARHE